MATNLGVGGWGHVPGEAEPKGCTTEWGIRYSSFLTTQIQTKKKNSGTGGGTELKKLNQAGLLNRTLNKRGAEV